MIKRLVYRYRWELGVFWLVPFVAGGMSLAYLELLFFELDLAMWPVHAQSFAILTVLIALYRLRPKGRPIFSLAVLFLIVQLAIDWASLALPRENLLNRWYMSDLPMEIQGLLPYVTGWFPAIILVWFADRAARISFRHALLFIALSPALDGASFLWDFTPFAQHGWLAAPITIWAVRIPHAVLAVFAIWVLTRIDSLEFVRARHLPVIGALLALGFTEDVLLNTIVGVSVFSDSAELRDAYAVAFLSFNWIFVLMAAAGLTYVTSGGPLPVPQGQYLRNYGLVIGGAVACYFYPAGLTSALVNTGGFRSASAFQIIELSIDYSGILIFFTLPALAVWLAIALAVRRIRRNQWEPRLARVRA